MVAFAFREIPEFRQERFVVRHRREHRFPGHRLYYLPSCGEAAYKYAYHVHGETDTAKHWELAVCAQSTGPAIRIASANLLLTGSRLTSYRYVRNGDSTVCGHVEEWPRVLLNGVLNFALEMQVKTVLVPTSRHARRHAGMLREPGPIVDYDDYVVSPYTAERKDAWWVVDVKQNRELIITGERRESTTQGKVISISHDIERGLGHRGIDSRFADHADAVSKEHLLEMLRIEKAAGVTATYNVVAKMLPEVRDEIEAGGHCLGFHSYDHEVRKPKARRQTWPASTHRLLGGVTKRFVWRGPRSQLARCREIDSRPKGYRPPRSVITRELNDRSLCYHDFKWLATSKRSLGRTTPVLDNRIVKIPIMLDDFSLYSRGVHYQEWEKRALDFIAAKDIAVVSLHDCYADYWISRYAEFLDKIRAFGRLRTLDEIADGVILGNAP